MGHEKHHHEEHANHERWLVSYADFITLLFAFFVVMYAVSEIDKRRMVNVADAVKFAFGAKGRNLTGQVHVHDLGGPSPLSPFSDTDKPIGIILPEKERKDLDGVETRISAELAPLTQDGALPEGVEMEVGDNGLLIRLSTVNFFDPGGAMLRPEALPILDAIGKRVGETGRTVRVQGHSDNMLVGARSAYPTNWELAAIRAVSVVRYFQEATKIPPARLTVGTFGQYKPIAGNDTLEGRARNRRIDVLVEPRPRGADEQ
jgi:chemotaxis protein MotB